MQEFSLIKQLKPELLTEMVKQKPPKINYQKYKLEVDGAQQIIKIPLTEVDNFESSIDKFDNPVTKIDLKKLLREHRGIRG